MYHPFLRGKQFELILLRENSKFIAENNIHPIIEPVKTDFKSLRRTFEVLNKDGVSYTLIVNPQTGESPVESVILGDFIDECGDCKNLNIGFVLNPNSRIPDLISLLNIYKKYNFSLLHYGFTNGIAVADAIHGNNNIKKHIFIDGFAGKLYQRHFKKNGVERILIRNGFKTRKKNSLYPHSEHFSDLHITFPDEGMDGFGDFLIVGDDYSESGGPAWAIAIHLTYLERDDDMYIYHFVSDQTQSPTNPGGKFLEALKKLVDAINKPRSLIFQSRACSEYLELFKKQHYPGLGYVKKLSMQHHLELIADYIKRNG